MLSLSRSTAQGATKITNAKYVHFNILAKIYVDAHPATFGNISWLPHVWQRFPECGFPLQAWVTSSLTRGNCRESKTSEWS